MAVGNPQPRQPWSVQHKAKAADCLLPESVPTLRETQWVGTGLLSAVPEHSPNTGRTLHDICKN